MKTSSRSTIYLIPLLCCCTLGKSVLGQRAADQERIKKNLYHIVQTPKSRNYQNVETLDTVSVFIRTQLKEVCGSTAYQEYKVNGVTYKNVIGSIGPKKGERIIIGAHYDVAGDQPGADDNASGVVGILELARLLATEELKYRIDFIAYTLEEPPFFRTEHMGSYIHAKFLKDRGVAVKGMICLESIGYYSNAPNSQNYPFPQMKALYGDKGDFIAVVQNKKAGDFSMKMADFMVAYRGIKTQIVQGSSSVPGVDFSDHLNYWKFGYDAIMITNTAVYRNPNYHTAKDTPETLDFNKIARVIEQLYQAIRRIE
ncbi:MAG: M28 family peptidase [Bacteroidota bacterium]